jgi:hypothetical protein
MRPVHAIACAALAACGATPDPADPGANTARPAVSGVRVGACAPVRYRELARDREPAPPPGPRITLAVDVPNRLRRTFRRALTREIKALEPELLRCFRPDELVRPARMRVSIYQTAAGRVTRIHTYASRHRRASRCVRDRLTTELKQLPPAGSSYGRATLSFAMSKTRPPDTPDRIELVEGRDRVETSLALAAAVGGKRDELAACVRESAPPSPGRIAATLLVEKGLVTTTEVNAPDDDLAACAASALTEIDLGDPQVGGTFECAAGYGTDRPARARFGIEIIQGAVIVGAGEPIKGALIREQRPPAGLLYKQLSERRFAADGGRFCAVRIAPNTSAALIVRATEAAAAADVAIASFEVERGGRWVAIAELADSPPPRLSKVAAQAAGPVVIAGPGSLWVGVGRGHHERELDAGALGELGAHLASLRDVSGVGHRTDVMLGLDGRLDGAAVAAVIGRIAAAGFDQIEIASAETARARLAQ